MKKEINYYVIEFENKNTICVLGIKQPTIEEANQFFKDDIDLYDSKVINIYLIDSKEAHESYDMENEYNFPVFGL